MEIPHKDAVQLTILMRNAEVSIHPHNQARTYLIQLESEKWIYWLHSNRWSEVDKNDEPFGSIYYGSVAMFYRKCILNSPEIPRNHCKRWERKEVNKLLKLMSQNKTLMEIACTLERTNNSVLAKTAVALGIELGHIEISEEDACTTLINIIDSAASIEPDADI